MQVRSFFRRTGPVAVLVLAAALPGCTSPPPGGEVVSSGLRTFLPGTPDPTFSAELVQPGISWTSLEPGETLRRALVVDEGNGSTIAVELNEASGPTGQITVTADAVELRGGETVQSRPLAFLPALRNVPALRASVTWGAHPSAALFGDHGLISRQALAPLGTEGQLTEPYRATVVVSERGGMPIPPSIAASVNSNLRSDDYDGKGDISVPRGVVWEGGQSFVGCSVKEPGVVDDCPATP